MLLAPDLDPRHEGERPLVVRVGAMAAGRKRGDRDPVSRAGRAARRRSVAEERRQPLALLTGAAAVVMAALTSWCSTGNNSRR
jgi:hypothetical protein